LRLGRLLLGQLGLGDEPFRFRLPLPAKEQQSCAGEEHECDEEGSAMLRTIHDTSRHQVRESPSECSVHHGRASARCEDN